MAANFYISTACAAAYGTLCVFIAIQARSSVNLLLAACCAVTAAWAGCGLVWPDLTLHGLGGALDIARMLVWYGYLLSLYTRAEIATRRHVSGFVAVALIAACAAILMVAQPKADSYSLFSVSVIVRLMISISALLLIENLYLNLPEYARWHVAIPCILLGGIACFDILFAAETALFHAPSEQLASTRMLVLVVIAPLLVLAASRGERWTEPVRLSRTAIFHSATLVLSGSVLLALAFVGELLRRLDADLGRILELSLLFIGILGVGLFVSSRSARSFFQRVIVRHFFADRYDYRLQWLRCISTLSGTGTNERTELSTRAIRAVADVVDSPNGSLFLHDAAAGVMSWAGSWNMPVASPLSINHPAIQNLVNHTAVLNFDDLALSDGESAAFGNLRPVWLAVPLLHNVGVIGMVIVGPARTAFQLDQEVVDLLRILGREVGTYIAEQQATEAMLQTRELHDYGQRFAFVAHDIKNVSSQLALLLRNAEHHLTNPEFQRDMIQTVGASVLKIDALLRRLDQRPALDRPVYLDLIPCLHELVASYERTTGRSLILRTDQNESTVRIDRDNLHVIVGHLLNNAVESDPTGQIEVSTHHDARSVNVDIADHGTGMSAEFIRDELFKPFKTTKRGGSGIGAYQVRELLRAVGGQLSVTSKQGIGTTMRITLPRADEQDRAATGRPLLSTIGD